MASVQPYLSKRDGKRAGWRAMWRDHEGKQRSKTFQRQIDADRHIATVTADLLRGAYVDPRAGAITLNEYASQWMASQNWRQGTRTLAESHLRNHIGPGLGNRKLATITRTDVQGFVTGLSKSTGDAEPLAPRTVELVYRRLVSILESAVHDRRIARSPAVRISRPKVQGQASNQMVTLSLDDVHLISETVVPWMRAFPWVIATAGLRPGEAAGLTVESIDFLRREIRVDRQMTSTTRSADDTPAGETRSIVALGPLKTPGSYRTVPVADPLLDELNRHMAQRPPVEFEAGATLLFTNKCGRPLSRTTLSYVWKNAAAKLEIPAEARGWHSLRHTYASWLIEGGLSVRAVQARLGHASATETLQTYSHLWPDSDDDTRRVIEARLTEAGAPGARSREQ